MPVEKKRKKRMKKAGLLKEEADSYDTLVCIRMYVCMIYPRAHGLYVCMYIVCVFVCVCV